MQLSVKVDPRILRRFQYLNASGAAGALSAFLEPIPKDKDSEEFWLVHAFDGNHNDASPHITKLFIFVPEQSASVVIASNAALAANDRVFTLEPFLLGPGMQLGVSVDALGGAAVLSAHALVTRMYMPKGNIPKNPLELIAG